MLRDDAGSIKIASGCDATLITLERYKYTSAGVGVVALN